MSNEGEKIQKVLVHMPTSTKLEVERIAKKRKASQQQVFRMLLELGIEVHRDMEKVGVIKAVDFSYYVRRAVKEKMEKSGAMQTNII